MEISWSQKSMAAPLSCLIRGLFWINPNETVEKLFAPNTPRVESFARVFFPSLMNLLTRIYISFLAIRSMIFVPIYVTSWSPESGNIGMW
jgi:hypothetical protein